MVAFYRVVYWLVKELFVVHVHLLVVFAARPREVLVPLASRHHRLTGAFVHARKIWLDHSLVVLLLWLIKILLYCYKWGVLCRRDELSLCCSENTQRNAGSRVVCFGSLSVASRNAAAQSAHSLSLPALPISVTEIPELSFIFHPTIQC